MRLEPFEALRDTRFTLYHRLNRVPQFPQDVALLFPDDPLHLPGGRNVTHKLLALFGLKWNPFAADVPVDALWRSPKIEHFCWRMESLVREGGFALITGDPGTGKSVALRTLAHHLAALPDVITGVLTRPQSGLADFYREMGHLFGVALAPHNRWVASRFSAIPG
jgi:AAA domain-containing protein